MGPRQGASEDEIFYKGDPTTVKLGRLTLMPPLPNTKVYIDPQPPLNVLFGGPDGHLSMPDVEALLGHVKFVVGCLDRFFDHQSGGSVIAGQRLGVGSARK